MVQISKSANILRLLHRGLKDKISHVSVTTRSRVRS
uniref:Uncharacterized protein n=1 Tax=Anguilla anguilla TaxID=7936 RepID=A0A0E9PQQ1_ANGAN